MLLTISVSLNCCNLILYVVHYFSFPWVLQSNTTIIGYCSPFIVNTAYDNTLLMANFFTISIFINIPYISYPL